MVPHRGCRDDPNRGDADQGGGRRGPRIIRAMLLALDIGNTNVTLGLFRAGALLATRRAATDPRATTDELALLLDGLLRLDGIAAADIDAVALASVVPSLTDAVGGLRRAARGVPARAPARAPSRSRSASTGRARSGPTGWSTPWPPPGCTGRRPSSSTSARRPRSTAWPRDGAYVGGAIAPGPRPRTRGARGADRQAAPDRAARPGPGDRAGHGQRDAVGRRPRPRRRWSPGCWRGSGASWPMRTGSRRPRSGRS